MICSQRSGCTPAALGSATATFTALLVQVLGLVIVAGGLGAGLDSVQQKLETVEKQTNGTLSALREDNDRLHAENAKLNRQLHPEDSADH
ncbi:MULTISPECIES: hypothetical protein [Microbacterium]|uniref:hypothetical protein n=1 Tax=Microbacterium TaxID=33882 RepID=UPI002780F588|nr:MULTISPECIES: hypothetical protein [Microbacterium]MDQ1083886.1 cell division protein FtsB [Microbacterium sp. SORGH_AS_0344]MDQ1170834.1 cell division protein FtsB [Microbacterium proteolyticum]